MLGAGRRPSQGPSRERRGAGVAAVLVLLALVVGAPGTGAHEAEPGVRPRLLEVTPEVDGLVVEVGQVVAPTMTVRNGTGAPVEVVGGDGVPFLRIGPDAVRANVASPDFFRSESPSPAVAVPAAAAPGAAPRFVTIAGGAEWSWFEHRIATADRGGWTVPLVAGDRPVSVAGDWEAVDVPGAFTVTVDDVDPPADGLRVEPLQGAVPGLFVANATGRPLEVPGPRGEAFLRIGPDVTERADGDGGWEQVAPAPRYGWTEPRIGWPAGEELPEELRAASSERTVRSWTLAMTLGGRPVTLAGTLRWVPVGGHHGDGFPMVPVLAGTATAVAAAALVALTVAARRGRRRPANPA